MFEYGFCPMNDNKIVAKTDIPFTQGPLSESDCFS